MSTGQAKLLDSASGQVSFRYNMKYIYHCEYLVKELDTQQYTWRIHGKSANSRYVAIPMIQFLNDSRILLYQ